METCSGGSVVGCSLCHMVDKSELVMGESPRLQAPHACAVADS